MHKFTSALSVSVAAFPATAQFIFEANAETRGLAPVVGVAFMWRSGVKIEYSFDGTTVHGDLEDGLLSEGLVLDGVKLTKGAIWFRAASASTVRVEVWDQS